MFVLASDDSEFSPLKPLRSEPSKPKRVMTLPGDHLVTMVDTDQQLMRCAEIVGQSDMVGLDAEWKPAFCGESGILSLLQIATSHESFLVDVIALQNSPVWKTISRVLFMDSDILKLGKLNYKYRQVPIFQDDHCQSQKI